MDWLRLAFRNVLRQRHRSGIAIGAVAFGVIALVLAGGFIEWLFWAMREDAIRSRLGHLQITRPGYYEEGVADPMSYVIRDRPDELTRLEAASGVATVAPRLAFTGLASHGAQTLPFIGEGVVAEKEARLERLDVITAGRDLAPADESAIMLGQGLAAALGVSVGDTLVLLASARGAGINAVEAPVVGFFSTSAKAVDDSALRVPLGLAQKLLRVTGAHVWVVLLDRTEDVGTHVATLAQQPWTRDLEVVPWTRLADLYNKTVALFSRQVAVVKAIVAAIIVLAISNTMMMSAIERTSEIGTAMALGTPRRRILGQFLVEGLLIGALGGTIGLAVGWALAQVISAVGIPMPPAPGMVRGYTAGIMPTARLAIDAVAIALATTLAASLYPAWKASRMAIVDALRHSH